MSDIIDYLKDEAARNQRLTYIANTSRLKRKFKYRAKHWQRAITEIERLTAENARYEMALRWALGELPPNTPEFPIVNGPPYYRWRTQLRELSRLAPDRHQTNE